MYIKCWGSRGSIPVSGENYRKYGGDTTCLEIRTKSGEIVIVDAGTGIRRMGNQMVLEERKSFDFIFTHAHWDHVMGFPFFKPIFNESAEFRMHKCPFHSKFVETILSRVMSPPNFPVRYRDLKANILYEDACPAEFRIGSMDVIPIALSHPNNGSGYKFIEDGKSFVFLTDNELGFVHSGGLAAEAYQEYATGADLLFHDAEYKPEEYRYTIEWGHSTYLDALSLAMGAGVKRFGLFHLNQDRFDDDMDTMVSDCRRRVTEAGSDLECFAVGADMVFEL
jgi:phosphoribosyl 1,2-cyclic phosphodiesterase